MGFGIRLAPGVRVGISKRGVRTSLGPRIATVHMGAGRAGFSTGLGPVSYGTALGGGRRSSGRPRRGFQEYYFAEYVSYAAYEKYTEAQRVEETLRQWTQAHAQAFPAAQRPIVPLVNVPSEEALARDNLREELIGVRFFQSAKRAEARGRAAERAANEHKRLRIEAEAQREELQREADEVWERLISNDPNEVFAQLTDAFGDNDAFASVVNVEGSSADLIMVVPGLEVIPEKTTGITPTGKLSLKRMSASERNAHYYDLVPSQVFATVREALSVAVGLSTIRLAALRVGPNGLNGIECVGFGTFSREAVGQADLSQPASTILFSSFDWVAEFDARLKVLPLRLEHFPEIAELIRQLDSSHDTEAAPPAQLASVLGKNQLDADLDELLEITRKVVEAQVGRADWVQQHCGLSSTRAKEIIFRLREAGIVGAAGNPNNHDLMFDRDEVSGAIERMRMLYGPLNQNL